MKKAKYQFFSKKFIVKRRKIWKKKDIKEVDEFEESYAGKKGRRAKDEIRLINNSLQDEK